jgi:hypothetical protein
LAKSLLWAGLNPFDLFDVNFWHHLSPALCTYAGELVFVFPTRPALLDGPQTDPTTIGALHYGVGGSASPSAVIGLADRTKEIGDCFDEIERPVLHLVPPSVCFL